MICEDAELGGPAFVREATYTATEIAEPSFRGMDRAVSVITAMSEHLLALLRHADGLGLVLYTRAHVRGNALKAEVTIYPTRTADLPQAWIADLATHIVPSTEIAASLSLDVAEDGTPSVPAQHLPPPPGWYRDPAGPGLRWWDGSAWTAYTAPIGQRL